MRVTDSKKNIHISRFGSDQADILYKRLILQKLCPGKFLIDDPWPYDELDDDGIEAVKDVLRELMPLDTLVSDLWDWDIHCEETTFEDTFFDVALGPEEYALKQADGLKEDILWSIDEFSLDFAEEQFNDGEFELWVHEQCREFIQKWRHDIFKRFS